MPDIGVYIEALEQRVAGQALERVRLVSAFLLRTVTPPLADAHGKTVIRVRRLGERIVLAGIEDELFLVLHLMIAGRLHSEGGGREGAAPARAGGVRVRLRYARVDEGRYAQARLAARGAR